MCREEFRLEMVKPNHDKVRDFVVSPWLPWYLFAVYRFLLAAYCLCWVMYSGYYFRNGGPLWFIYLTNLGYLSVSLYFIAATVVTLWHHYKEKHQGVAALEMKQVSDVERNGSEPENEIPLKWYHQGTWVLFNFSGNNAIIITVLYWSLLFNGKTNGLDVSTHLLNSAFILAEVLLSSIPIHLLHIVYSWCFVIMYMFFSVVYWAAGGTNYDNEPYIYPYLDYDSDAGLAIGLFCACLFVGGPLSQLLLFGLYKLRTRIAIKCGRLD